MKLWNIWMQPKDGSCNGKWYDMPTSKESAKARVYRRPYFIGILGTKYLLEAREYHGALPLLIEALRSRLEKKE